MNQCIYERNTKLGRILDKIYVRLKAKAINVIYGPFEFPGTGGTS